jgi:hypothetical protein
MVSKMQALECSAAGSQRQSIIFSFRACLAARGLGHGPWADRPAGFFFDNRPAGIGY